LNYNYKVTIHYDGTAYSGWQYQTPKIPTIQAEMMRALQIIAKKRMVVTGSSRTDAGVHSAGLVANFHLPWAIEALSLRKALNALLPDNIRIMSCEKADPSFNARFGAKGKTYRYRLFYGQIQSPFSRLYAAHFPFPLDIPAMRRATRYFIGQKDFTSFTSDEPEKKKIREIEEFSMRVKNEEIVFIVRGKSFLRYMVRNMVGTIIDVGRGRILAREIPDIFEARDRRKAGQTAPARGLTLMKVEY
jgi:tRNA pseudouridine38-40 synthase